jgi:hypothetical protein
MRFGGIYPYFEEDEIKQALLKQIRDKNLRFVLPVFWEAWESKFWRTEGYDGATMVQDKAHPSIDIFLHDWGYRVYGGNFKDDYIFFKLQKLLGDKALRNYIGVRIGGVYFRLKNRLIKEKKGTSTEKTEELYKFLKTL